MLTLPILKAWYLFAMVPDDKEEMRNKAVMQILKIRKIKSTKKAAAKVKKDQQHHRHLTNFEDYSFNQLNLTLKSLP